MKDEKKKMNFEHLEYLSNPVVRELMEASNDGFWDWNIETGEVYFSGRWARMLGYEQNEVEPNVKSWEKIVHPEDMSHVMEMLQAHLDGKTDFYETEHRVKCKDGSWKWILDRGRVISRSKDGKPLRAAGAHTDISERIFHEQQIILNEKKEEQSRKKLMDLNLLLRESQRVYQETFDLAAIGIAHVDKDHAWIKANHALSKITGYTEDELRNTSCLEMIHEEDRQLSIENKRKIIEGKVKSYSMEVRFKRKDGKLIWINLTTSVKKDSNNNPEYFIFCIDDVTNKKHDELEREKNRATLQTIVNSTTDLIYVKDNLGRYKLINPPVVSSLSQVIGPIEVNDIIGKNDKEIMGEKGELIFKTDQKIMETKSVNYLEETISTQSGDIIYDSVKNPIFNSKGEVIGIVGISRDITDKKKFQQKLHEAIKLRDEFLSIASHELKTPLTSLVLLVQSMKRIINASDNQLKIAEKIKKSIDQTEKQLLRLSHLIDEMLDITRIQSGKMVMNRTPFDLHDLIKEVSERLMPQVQSATGISIKILKVEHSVGTWDRYRIEQVITNIVTNAIKYGEGKPIEVTLENFNNEALIKIKDYGLGIPKNQHEKIFNRFERGNHSVYTGGLGLGLFISKQIIDSHKGKIWVESEPGKGSTFIVLLPKEPISQIQH